MSSAAEAGDEQESRDTVPSLETGHGRKKSKGYRNLKLTLSNDSDPTNRASVEAAERQSVERTSVERPPGGVRDSLSKLGKSRTRIDDIKFQNLSVTESFEVHNASTFQSKGFVINSSGVMRTPQPHQTAPTPAAPRTEIKQQSPEAVEEVPPKPEVQEDSNGSSASSPSLGRSISAQDLVRIGDLGVGQNGTVVKALYLPELDIVALKTVNIYDKSKRHQMVKELSAFSTTDHPNIVKLVGAYFHEGNIVIALEYMNRGSLRQIIEAYGPMPEPVLRIIIKQVLAGLVSLHSQYQVHRDIKADNILLTHAGVAKISDFGLTKQLDNSQAQCRSFVGTMTYLSPERITGTEFGFPSDIWSVGITMIYCVTANLPLPNEYWAVLDKIKNNASPKLDRTKFSRELCDFVDSCLYKDPTKRMTARELLNHPFLQPHEEDSKVEWPYKGVREGDLKDLSIINALLLERLYSDGVFKNSLKDRARFGRIGEQLGFTMEEVSRDFQRQFRAKFQT